MRRAAALTAARVRSMIDEVCTSSHASAEHRLGLLDAASQFLCETADMCEVRRFLHPQASGREDADAASGDLAHLIADLNTDPRLYAALVEICAQGEREGFDEEQRRVSAAYRSELEAHGVHLLNDEARGQIVELQTRLARLSFAFGNGDGSQLYGLLEAREELANLLGFACYADLVMPSKVMGSRKAVLDLLDRVEALPRPMERRIFVNSGPVSLEQVLRGLAGLADLISSLPCKPIQPADLSKACLSDGVLVGGEEAGVWAKQTKAWELGKRGRVLLDLEARPNKLQQPATFMLRFAVRNTKSSARNDCALVAAVSNPASLTRHEIDSLFHEWGHVLAAVCSDTRYQQLASTRASLDFVEAPSMLIERLAWHPSVLPVFAGVKMEERVVSGDFDLAGQVRLARRDMLLHSEGWRNELARGGCESFAHLGPYGASYYSYIVCRLFASNLYHHALKSDLSGGKKVTDGLLRFGGARDPLAVMRECTGKDPFDLAHFHD